MLSLLTRIQDQDPAEWGRVGITLSHCRLSTIPYPAGTLGMLSLSYIHTESLELLPRMLLCLFRSIGIAQRPISHQLIFSYLLSHMGDRCDQKCIVCVCVWQ